MNTKEKMNSDYMLKKIGYANLNEEAKKIALESGLKALKKEHKLKEKPKVKAKKKKVSGMVIKRSVR